MKRETSACIVELRGRYAAALTEDGQFVRIRNRAYEVGQTVRLSKANPYAARRAQFRAMATMAAGLLLLLLGGFKGYQTPVGVVSLDVNPSIEYTINAFDRVLSIHAVNSDAETILNQMDESTLTYQPVEDAVEQTIETLRANGYLTLETENDIVLSASSYTAQHAERLAEQLKTRVSQQQDLTVISISVTSEEVEQAHTLGVSAGKVRIVEELGQSSTAGDGFDRADWLGKPVREILQKTQEQESPNPSSGAEQEELETQPQQTPQQAPIATPNPLMPQPTASPSGMQQQTGGNVPVGGGSSASPTQGSPGGKPSSGSFAPPRH